MTSFKKDLRAASFTSVYNTSPRYFLVDHETQDYLFQTVSRSEPFFSLRFSPETSSTFVSKKVLLDKDKNDGRSVYNCSPHKSSDYSIPMDMKLLFDTTSL